MYPCVFGKTITARLGDFGTWERKWEYSNVPYLLCYYCLILRYFVCVDVYTGKTSIMPRKLVFHYCCLCSFNQATMVHM